MVLRLLSKRIIEHRGSFWIFLNRNNVRRISCFVPETQSCKPLRIIKSDVRQLHTSLKLDELVRFNLADIGEGIKEVVIKEWYISVGDHVSQFDNICEVQSDKATVTITSRYDGIVKKLYHELDDTAFVGKPLIDIEIEGPGGSSGTVTTNMTDSDVKESDTEEAYSSTAAKSAVVLTTPAVRKIAKENNIDLGKVVGSGPNNRILKEDLLAIIEGKQKPQGATKETSNIADTSRDLHEKGHKKSYREPKYDRSTSYKDEIRKFNPIQKAMFKSMTQAASIPQFNYCDEINLTKLNTLTHLIPSVSFMPVLIKALSMALSKYPELNAQIDESGEKLIIKKQHNIGVAVATKSGLVVPKIHNVQEMSLGQLNDVYSKVIQKARKGHLSLDDNMDGTITISNIGAIGGTYTKPVILPPELVIVAFGASRYLPVCYKDGTMKPRMEMHMPVSWSADHRAVDGATIANFSNYWKGLIENPYSMDIELH